MAISHFRRLVVLDERDAPAELADPELVTEVRTALDELTQLLELGTDFYDFQRA